MVTHAYIISRVGDFERQRWATDQALRLGVDFRFFPAMQPDGHRWGPLNTRLRGMRKNGAFGCLLSHYHVLQDALLNGQDALVFEDDLLPMPGFAFDFTDLPPADMYYFGWITWGAPAKIEPVTEQWHKRSNFAGTHCYFVPHGRIQKVLDWYNRSKWDLQIDNLLATDQGALDLLFKSGARVVQNTELGTTIGNRAHQSDVDFAKPFLTKPF